MIATPIPVATAAVVFVAIAAVGDVFTGDYTSKTEDGTVTLALAQEGEAVTGTFSDGSSPMTLRGKVTAGGKQVSGNLALNGQELPITPVPIASRESD